MTPEGFVAERIVTIGTSAGSRVWMLKLPQEPDLPAVRVQWIDDVQDQHLMGPNPVVTRVQVDDYVADIGDAYAAVRDLADEIHGDGLGYSASGVFGFKGEVGSPAILIENVRLAFRGQPTYEGDEKRLLGIRQDYLVYWRIAN